LEWAEDDGVSDDSDSAGSKPSDPLKLSSSLYSRRTIDTVNLLDPRQIPYDLVVRILETLCLESAQHADYSHAVLIFLPGLQEIRKMHDALVDHNVFGNPNAFVLFPLHSTISSEGQSAVFDIPPPGIRKIVIGEAL
jgi:ATP-dependent RNA helicase DHX29